jgi:aminopeptidase N
MKPNLSSESLKWGIAQTYCHELAHVWFGNLATTEFWRQLWLKEGIAQYMEFVGVYTP